MDRTGLLGISTASKPSTPYRICTCLDSNLFQSQSSYFYVATQRDTEIEYLQLTITINWTENLDGRKLLSQ